MPKAPTRFCAELREATAARHRMAALDRTEFPAGSPAARPLGGNRQASGRARGELPARREAVRDDERSAAAVSCQLAGWQARGLDGGPELRALVRTLPVAVEASRIREGEPLALSFGRSLSVEIRGGAAGLEILLRPDASLVRAASAELPALVAALRTRGITVARAEVRGGAGRSAAGARRPR